MTMNKKNVYLVTNYESAQVTVIANDEDTALQLASEAFRKEVDLYSFYMISSLEIKLIQEGILYISDEDYVSKVEI